VVSEPAQPAGSFANSVGVNVHVNYSDTAYADTKRVRGALRGLGIRHVLLALLRDDGAPSGGGTVTYRLTGDLTGVDHLLLRTSAGAYVLLLWQHAQVWDPVTHSALRPPVPAADRVPAGVWRQATVVRPASSQSPLVTMQQPRELAIGIPGDVMAVALTPQGRATAAVRHSRYLTRRTRRRRHPSPALGPGRRPLRAATGRGGLGVAIEQRRDA